MKFVYVPTSNPPHLSAFEAIVFHGYLWQIFNEHRSVVYEKYFVNLHTFNRFIVAPFCWLMHAEVWRVIQMSDLNLSAKKINGVTFIDVDYSNVVEEPGVMNDVDSLVEWFERNAVNLKSPPVVWRLELPIVRLPSVVDDCSASSIANSIISSGKIDETSKLTRKRGIVEIAGVGIVIDSRLWSAVQPYFPENVYPNIELAS